MPRTRTCDYCGADINPGTGTMFVRKNGSTVHYCSAKCEKNADLGREARDLEWTAAGQAEGGEAVEETVEPDEVEEVDEREAAGTTPDLEEAEQEAAAEADAEADETEVVAEDAEPAETEDESAAAEDADDEAAEDAPAAESAEEDGDEDADEETEEAQA